MFADEGHNRAEEAAVEYERSARAVMEPSPPPAKSADPCEKKLQELRQLSNVIQALENLVTQCGMGERFESLKAMAASELHAARKALVTEIHSSPVSFPSPESR